MHRPTFNDPLRDLVGSLLRDGIPDDEWRVRYTRGGRVLDGLPARYARPTARRIVRHEARHST
jgi:hypothetical protein